MTKAQARRKLQDIVDRETGNPHAKPDDSLTFEWFWKNRYKPVKAKSLKASSRYHLVWLVEKHLMPRFGQRPLGDITRFELQSYLQELADQGYSCSIIHKARTYLNSVLDEALKQDFLAKNPARKLDKPPSQKRQTERVLVEDELPELFEKLNARDRLITEIFLFCGLPPGELFVLRWSDWERRELRIDEAIWQGQIGETKTPTSSGFVSLPSGIEAQLQIWKQVSQPASPNSWIFPSTRGTLIRTGNWLQRNLKPAAEAAGLDGVTIQALRRTFATLIQKVGSVKDAQAQLRHASPQVTLGVYMKAIPESIRRAVEALYAMLHPKMYPVKSASPEGTSEVVQ